MVLNAMVCKALFVEPEVMDHNMNWDSVPERQTRSENDSEFGMMMEDNHDSALILAEQQAEETIGEVLDMLEKTDSNTTANYLGAKDAPLDAEMEKNQAKGEEEPGDITTDQMIVDSVDEIRMEEDIGEKEKHRQYELHGRNKGSKGNVILKGAGSKKHMVQALVSEKEGYGKKYESLGRWFYYGSGEDEEQANGGR